MRTSRLLVVVYLVLIPLGSSAIALAADRDARPGLLWRAVLTLGLLLAAGGFVPHRIDLQRTGSTEGSGMTPIALGLVVPLISAAIVRRSRGWKAPLRIAVAAIVAVLASPPLAMLSHYVLSALVPDYISMPRDPLFELIDAVRREFGVRTRPNAWRNIATAGDLHDHLSFVLGARSDEARAALWLRVAGVVARVSGIPADHIHRDSDAVAPQASRPSRPAS